MDKRRQKKPPKGAVSGMPHIFLAFEIGDNVVVKQGTLDPDYPIEIGGWQGRILEIEKMMMGIDLSVLSGKALL